MKSLPMATLAAPTPRLRSFIVSAVLLTACARSTQPVEPRNPPVPSAPASPAPARPVSPDTATPVTAPRMEPVAPMGALRRAAPARLIAIGDVHGDLSALRSALRLGGAIDAQDHWSGGSMTVVQTGDMLDRGDDDREILDAIERWSQEAERAGGTLVALNGNHEVMNVQGDFRYVTRGGFEDFHGFAPGAGPTEGRAAAFAPGGAYARRLAPHPTVLIVGDTIFAHGGVLPEHVSYGLARINEGVRAWMLGTGALPSPMRDEQAPIWFRGYSLDADDSACALLGRTLESLGARRMVVGHTVQPTGVNAACNDRIWRIDVGMSRHYGGPVQVLEIEGSRVRALRAPAN